MTTTMEIVFLKGLTDKQYQDIIDALDEIEIQWIMTKYEIEEKK